MTYQWTELSPDRIALYLLDGPGRDRIRSIVLLRRDPATRQWTCAACGRADCRHARAVNQEMVRRMSA